MRIWIPNILLTRSCFCVWIRLSKWWGCLKVVCNEKEGGAEKMANVGNGSETMAVEVCFSFNFAVVFYFNLYPVLPSKAKSIGDVLMNRQNAATWYLFFFLFYKAMRGEQKKKIREIKFENYRRSKFGLCYCFLLAQFASLSPSITQKTNLNQRRIICCVFPIHGEIA